jgi:hypothetical protein
MAWIGLAPATTDCSACIDGELPLSSSIFTGISFFATVLCFFAICEFVRAVASVNLLASNDVFGNVICPGIFSLFLFLPTSLATD